MEFLSSQCPPPPPHLPLSAKTPKPSNPNLKTAHSELGIENLALGNRGFRLLEEGSGSVRVLQGSGNTEIVPAWGLGIFWSSASKCMHGIGVWHMDECSGDESLGCMRASGIEGRDACRCLLAISHDQPVAAASNVGALAALAGAHALLVMLLRSYYKNCF